MSVRGNDYASWNERELRRAESVAGRFLQDNVENISESLRVKVEQLDQLVRQLHQPVLTLDQRLHIFASIDEIARTLQTDAQGFFRMASEPVVARILTQIEPKRR